jgi:TetR/AcrR family tetracycline transcriptional repressor
VTTDQIETPVRGRGRPPRISREKIIAAAVSLSREVGLADLRMSAVAERLGVRPSALNYYFSDRAELIELAAAAQLDWQPTEWKLGPETPWQDWARGIAHSARTTLLTQPELALHIRSTTTMGGRPSGFEVVDEFLGVLARAGFDEEGILRAPVFLMQVVSTSVQAELGAMGPEMAAEREAMVQSLSDLPDDALPRVRAFFAGGGYSDWETQFHFNVEGVIDALSVYLERVKGNTKGARRSRKH